MTLSHIIGNYSLSIAHSHNHVSGNETIENDDDYDPNDDVDEEEEEDYSGSKNRAKRLRREEPNQLMPTGSTATSAPVQVPSTTVQVAPPIEIPTDDNARRINIEREIAELETEMAKLKAEISDAETCLDHVQLKDRVALKSTFEQLQNS